ncbi:MAG: formylglycine-generating enzyme family protein [Deltaproteobacteria bacterium]|nr:formylglycine-generating enzyme family protein [Deltaproteobacteria bacterium]
MEDLPESYRATAAAGMPAALQDKNSRQLYLIGKYEVTVAQWDAIMKKVCPFDARTAMLPKTGISWHDAQSFDASLMEWVLENSPDSLPSNKDDPRAVGQIRLPTEDEWEYAARGGHRVSSEEMSILDFFPIFEGEGMDDYSVFSNHNSPVLTAPSIIARRKPNPAGLYDTAGNVSEMTGDPYRIVVGNRLHGSAGGFVLKGGSFRSHIFGILPGARDEQPFFFRTGAAKRDDMGFRLTLSSINIGSVTRLEEIQSELERLSQTDETLIQNERR